MKKRLWFHLLAVVLIVVLVTALSVTALAADEPEDPGVYVSKQAIVQEDGTYVLDLEAYATGTVTTTTEFKPTDLVLVLDASTSMGQTSSTYLMADGSVRIQALVDAVNSFLETVAEKNAENDEAGSDLSTVAIVVFSGQNNTQTIYNFTEITSSNLTANSVYATYNGRTYTSTAYGTNGKGFALNNQTYTNSGLSRANTLLETLITNQGETVAASRNRVVVLFTDGYPNRTGGLDGFDVEECRNVITTARTIKSARQASIFTIAVIGDVAKPGLDPTTTSQQNYGGQNQMRMNQMLHAASSNYPQASVSGTWNINWGTGNYQNGYYKSASSAEELEDIFKLIAETSASTETPLTSESVMKDIVSSSFTLPEGASASTITVSVVPWDSTAHTWSTTKISSANWVSQCRNYGAEADENISVVLKDDGKTVDVTGFDYGTHFLATSDPTQDVNNINKNSAKLVITFPILAKPSAVTGGYVATNGPESGIYLDGNATEPLIKFPQPEVVFTPITYVVDYVTSDTTADTKASTVTLDYSSVLKNVEMLDDPSDDVLKGEKVSSGSDNEFNYTIYKGKYGTISYGDDAGDVNQKMRVRYAPTTMCWDDYDRIFIKGESKTESNLDVWAMLCVVPANTVYYEDTYVTITKNVTYNNQNVEIKYTGIDYTGDWSLIGTEGDNTTQHADKDAEGNPLVMGWVDVLANDAGYSNGMAHTASTSGAKASFPFSGTGVEIYSRTNGTTGSVLVQIRKAVIDENGNLVRDENGNLKTGKLVRAKSIDTKAAGGDYYGVPVCSFLDLSYGTYVVSVQVTTGGQKEGRMTYYIEGVRVYNPIQPHESEQNIIDMYGAENLGAVFTPVRDLLGNGATATALFIDQHTVSEVVTNTEAITKAAQAMAAAQDALDVYDNTKSALDNAVVAQDVAQKAYEKAVEEGASEDELAELETALNNANDALDDAQDALTALFGEMTEEAYVAKLNTALTEARAAYATANDGMQISYSTTDVSEYDKEGPKSEVLLENGQSVVISVKSGYYYYVGLKEYARGGTTATINGKACTVAHATDLYYDATPASDGTTITITNTGDGILSITKLRTCGSGNTESGTKAVPVEELFTAFKAMAAAPVVPYDGEILTEEEATATLPAEEPVVEEEPAEETVVDLDEADITIENPEPVPAVSNSSGRRESSFSAMSGVISSFKGFVRR